MEGARLKGFRGQTVPAARVILFALCPARGPGPEITECTFTAVPSRLAVGSARNRNFIETIRKRRSNRP